MGKNKSRQKKNKYKDFQKVKLKVGKKLPRGLNETVATFKSKGIQIKEQLKSEKDIDEPTTKRKLNITDLLSQCQHYSSSVRHDAVMGMRELLTHNTMILQRKLIITDLLSQCQHYSSSVRHDAVMGMRELLTHNTMILQKHIGQIIERCSELFLDKDPVVRSTVHKMLRTFLSKLTSSQMSAFFPVLSAHLCCAMTHIDDNIQQDSLEILDICIDFFPALVVSNSSQIMSNFVEQISRQIQTSSKGTVQQRSLLVNPSSKLSSQKWRNKVLQRLKKFFDAYLEHQCDRRNLSNKPENVDYIWWEQSLTTQLLKSPLSTESQNQLFLFKKLDQNVSADKNLQSFIEVLVPLLMQCWVEASPSQLATDLAGNALDAVAMTTLWNVLNVLQLLMEVIEHHSGSSINFEWFADKYLQVLVQYFMPYFPYSMHQQAYKGKQSGTKRSVANVGSTVSVKTLNLSVCKVMSYFINQTPGNIQWREKVVNYMTESQENTKINEEQVALLVGIINNVIYSTTDQDTINSMLQVAYDALNSRQHTTSTEMRHLLKFLNYFAFSKDGLRNDKYEILLKWVGSLPVLTWQALKVAEVKLDALNELLYYLKNAGPYRTEKYNTNLKKLLFEHVFVIGTRNLCVLPLCYQKRLIELLYWIPGLTRSEYQALTSFCQDSEININVVYHTLEVMTMRLEHTEDMATDITSEISTFLSFLLTLILGKRDQSDHNFLVAIDLYGVTINVEKACMDVKDTETRINIIQKASNMLTYLPEHYNISEIVETYLQTYLTAEAKMTGLPLLSAVGILNVISVGTIRTPSTNVHREDELLIHRNGNANLINEKWICNDILCDILGSVLSLLVETETVLSQTLASVQKEDSQTDVGHQIEEEMMDVNVASMSKDTKIRLWDVVTDTLLNLPHCCKMFVRRSCDKLQSITDMDRELKPVILVLTKLLNCSQLQHIIRTESLVIKNMMQEIDAQTKLRDQWWIAFKYEVSLLR